VTALRRRDGAQQRECLLQPFDGRQLIVDDRAQHLFALLIVLDLVDYIGKWLDR